MRSPFLSAPAFKLLILALPLWLWTGGFAQDKKDSPEAGNKEKGIQKIQEELVQLREAQERLKEDVAKLKEENAQLRKENQALRLLLAEQIGSTNTNSAAIIAPGLAQTNRLSPEAINAVTNWLTTSSGKRHNARCRYYKTTAGRLCGPEEGQPCRLCGG